MIVGGEALYGVPAFMEDLASTLEWCEDVSACGTNRTICVKSDSTGWHSDTLAEVENTLSAALGGVSMPSGLEYAGELLGLWMCEESRQSCDLSEVSEGDSDGDGVADEDDGCVYAYDPAQADHDKDGQGDACDPCPLDPTSDTCTHTPGDIDGDGVSTEEDVCPWIANADQEDRDGDAIGDACDLCPDEYSGEGTACTFELTSLRDPDDPLHPPEGTEVRVNDLVVTGIREGGGFYVQDPDADMYGGIYIYDNGAHTVSIGDLIDVVGTYDEYYSLSQIKNPTVTVKGEAEVPEPHLAAHPCDVATEGADAEPLESMRVEVVDLTVTDSNPDAPDDYGELEVNGCLRIDDQISDVLVPQPDEGATLSSMRGILTFSYGHHKLLPGGAEDVTW